MSAPTSAAQARPAAGASAARRPTKQRRDRQVRSAKHRMLTALSGILVCVLLLGSAWLVYLSDAFAAQHVTVHGNRELTAGQIADAAEVPLGLPLARQDLNAIAQRATTVPAVESAVVAREWPHTVAITIVEREPLLAVRQPGSFIVIDRLGVAFETRTAIPKGAVEAAVNPGDVPLLRDVGTVAQALSPGLRAKVGRINATTRDNISVTMKSGVQVTWGAASDSALKAQVTTALLKRKDIRSINVSSPHNPAIR